MCGIVGAVGLEDCSETLLDHSNVLNIADMTVPVLSLKTVIAFRCDARLAS